MFISHHINKISIICKIKNRQFWVRDISLHLKSDQNIGNGFTLHMELGSKSVNQEFETANRLAHFLTSFLTVSPPKLYSPTTRLSQHCPKPPASSQHWYFTRTVSIQNAAPPSASQKPYSGRVSTQSTTFPPATPASLDCMQAFSVTSSLLGWALSPVPLCYSLLQSKENPWLQYMFY